MDTEFSIAGSSKMSKTHAQLRNSSNSAAFAWKQEGKESKKGRGDDEVQAVGPADPLGTGITTGRGLAAATSVDASAQYFPADHRTAGNNHKVAERSGFSRSEGGAKWSSYKTREYSSGTPFGYDANAPNAFVTANQHYGDNKEVSNLRSARGGKKMAGGGGGVKSLAELIGQKSPQ